MNKKEFMQKLKQLLPDTEKRDILLDYEEHFLSGLSEGKTEEEIVAELGSPEEVATAFGYQEKMSNTNRVWAALGLVALDLFVGINVFFTVLSIWLGLWAIPLSTFLAGIALMVSSIANLWMVPLPWYILVTGGIAVLAFSVLSTIGMIYVTKGLYLGLKWYGKLHVRIFRGY